MIALSFRYIGFSLLLSDNLRRKPHFQKLDSHWNCHFTDYFKTTTITTKHKIKGFFAKKGGNIIHSTPM